jgi:cytochrome c oxidase accessory protein FixG
VTSLMQPEDRVLSTLNADGSRRWLTPRVAEGRLWKARRIVGYLLIAVFVTLPHLHAGGKQLFFANIAGGEFTAFGYTLIRTDTLLFALGLLCVFLTIFFFTALAGRVWCGWMCPQTVYLEFVFRPIDRLFDGKRNKKGLGKVVSALPTPFRKAGRVVVFTAISFVLANTFLSYFVGSATLRDWVTSSPAEHPAGFIFVVFVTCAMLFDFMFFREQLCIVACPYGRLQSALLDKHSLIVGYDTARGEPRGHGRPRKSESTGDVALPQFGDCVDCGNCTTVCPTGIDIRDGLQLECIHCAQCIDACNAVMSKLGREPGLIRYSSQDALATGKWKWLRPRIAVYPGLLVAILSLFTFLLVTKPAADVLMLRSQGLPFNVLPSGEVANQARLRITNRTPEPRTYTFSADGLTLQAENDLIEVAPGETVSERILVLADPEFFSGTDGSKEIRVRIADDSGFETSARYKMLGPIARGGAGDTPPVSETVAPSSDGETP